MLASALVLVPLGGALAVWILPLRTARAAGGLALLVALAELFLWVVVLQNFDFRSGSLQHGVDVTWFADLDAAYKVGLFDFSLWLVGVTALVTVAAVAYGMWVGRERPRAYFGLLLVLLGATVGVFVAQDLLLFYAFFEAMLVPLYVLVGVWGGTRRVEATVKFVTYTLAGSLLMLVAIIALGLANDTFDMTRLESNGSTWIFLGFLAAFAVKAPVFPFHGWLPDAYREAPAEVSALLSGVVSKTAAYGMLRIVLPSFPDPVSEWRTVVLALAAVGLVYGSLLAFRAPDFRGVVAYSSLAQMSLIVLGVFAVNDSGLHGALLHMVNHGLVSAALFLLAGTVERRAASGRLELLGGMARGRPRLASLLLAAAVVSLAVPLSTAFAAEFLILNGVFARGWGWAVVGVTAIVLAAAYMLRLVSAVLHEGIGTAVHPQALDLRPAEVAIVGALVVALVALSFWPAGITDHVFAGELPGVLGAGLEAAP
ncbi:MAG: NADH-quinone oxidoreductase subunit M [Thermoleophilia bacterium]|nr:NADH-quinone oxidoreductase subunit M [Thermoleophilia bacterium]